MTGALLNASLEVQTFYNDLLGKAGTPSWNTTVTGTLQMTCSLHSQNMQTDLKQTS